MEYRILGPLQVIDDGEPVDIGSPQQRSLLALLVLNANRVVSTERILEEAARTTGHRTDRVGRIGPEDRLPADR